MIKLDEPVEGYIAPTSVTHRIYGVRAACDDDLLQVVRAQLAIGDVFLDVSSGNDGPEVMVPLRPAAACTSFRVHAGLYTADGAELDDDDVIVQGLFDTGALPVAGDTGLWGDPAE